MVMMTADSTDVTIHTSLSFDSKRKTWATDLSFVISTDTGLIRRVYQRKETLGDVEDRDIDLRGRTVLPGFVDSHTHLFLHSYHETPSINQMRDESITERTIRATNHCRAALKAGYTTYRDLGTEGAFESDIHLRDAVNRSLIPGPRIFCATEALASSGGYEIRQENRIGGVELPRISDQCDGVVGVRAAVRRRLGAGADVIKFYADYRKRALRFPASSWTGCPDIQFPPTETNAISGERSPNYLLFDQAEMDAMVTEARMARAPVAAHASSPEAVMMASRAGVTTVEHGFMRSSEAMKVLKENGTIFVPTLAVVEVFVPDMSSVLEQTKEAYDLGVKIAAGGDTGAFAHGDNAREMELMLQAGLPLEGVLTAATLHGWEACGKDWCGRRFGSLEEGWAADFVAVEGDLRQQAGSGGLRSVTDVIKDGRLVVRHGKVVGWD